MKKSQIPKGVWDFLCLKISLQSHFDSYFFIILIVLDFPSDFTFKK